MFIRQQIRLGLILVLWCIFLLPVQPARAVLGYDCDLYVDNSYNNSRDFQGNKEECRTWCQQQQIDHFRNSTIQCDFQGAGIEYLSPLRECVATSVERNTQVAAWDAGDYTHCRTQCQEQYNSTKEPLHCHFKGQELFIEQQLPDGTVQLEGDGIKVQRPLFSANLLGKIRGLNKLGTIQSSADIAGFIGRVIRAAMSVIGTIALVMFIYGGLLWMTARGNSDQTHRAMKVISWSALGLIVILSSYTLIGFIFQGFLPQAPDLR